MFTNFHIERFRGIPALDIDGVKPITLLVGKNNSGKTSVLEAIFLLCGATDPISAAKIANQRGQCLTNTGDADTAWRSLFQGLNCEEPIAITGTWEGEGPRRLNVKAEESAGYSPDPARPISGIVEVGGRRRIGSLFFTFTSPAVAGRVPNQSIFTRVRFDPSTQQTTAEVVGHDYTLGEYSIRVRLLSARSFVHLSQDTDQYSSLVRTRREEAVVAGLRLVDPRVRKLDVISESSGATVYADLGGEALIPLAVCGEGMLRLFSTILAVTATKGGVLLIDEIDNGLHHSVMKELWPLMRKLCAEHNVQLIATTHNDEILRYAIKAFEDAPEIFGVFRLDRVGETMKAVGYHGEVLGAVYEMPWEIRG
jgi:predicted ATPase